MKYLLVIIAILIASTASAQRQANSDTSKKVVIFLNEAELDQLFYVIGTSAKLTAVQATDFITALSERVQHIAPATTRSTTDSTSKKTSPKKPR